VGYRVSPLPQQLLDLLDHRADIREHLFVGEPQDIMPEQLKLHVPAPVVGEFQPSSVLGSVYLDHEALGRPEQVQPVCLAEQVVLERVVPTPATRPVVPRERPLQCELGGAVRPR
jgi:hypothetical protein